MPSEIHSIVFKSRWWSPIRARKWLSEHGHVPIKRVDRTKNTLNYRIKDPKLFKTFITKKISPSINLVLGIR